MNNTSMSTTRRALLDLRAAQTKHARLRGRADARLEAAKARHAAEIAAAADIEQEAWRALLAIPGVSIDTAAALVDVSETTVNRWASRGGKQNSTGLRR